MKNYKSKVISTPIREDDFFFYHLKSYTNISRKCFGLILQSCDFQLSCVGFNSVSKLIVISSIIFLVRMWVYL